MGAKLLITSFIKRSQPILRYEITDRVSLTTAPCPCGRPLARILSIEGRSEDLLRFESAGKGSIAVHPHTLRSPMAALPELRQYQIVHDLAGLHVVVQVRDGVAAQEVSRRIERELRNKLLAVGVVTPHLDVTVVDGIPREHGHGAKFKQIESREARDPPVSRITGIPHMRSRKFPTLGAG